MLRTTLVPLLALILSLPSALQSQIRVGASGGVNRTSMSGDALPNTAYTAQLGFSVSAIVDVPLGDDIRLSLQPGYTRVGTGIALTSVLRDPRDSLNATMDYIVLPVLARVVARNGVTFATGGMQVAMLINAASAPVSGGPSKDITSVVADVDLALMIGVGAQIPVSTAIATIELRYTQSLLNAGKTEEAAEAFQMPPRFRLSGLQLIAGVLFHL